MPTSVVPRLRFSHEPLGDTELPPRARRIQAIRDGADINQGTTSAYAENTRGRLPPPYQKWNYLSVHGEYVVTSLGSTPYVELPPRARRIQAVKAFGVDRGGTTSACAENTDQFGEFGKLPGNYLRVRGEYRSGRICRGMCRELPPRARRIPGQWEVVDTTWGTTSACAENTFRYRHQH